MEMRVGCSEEVREVAVDGERGVRQHGGKCSGAPHSNRDAECEEGGSEDTRWWSMLRRSAQRSIEPCGRGGGRSSLTSTSCRLCLFSSTRRSIYRLTRHHTECASLLLLVYLLVLCL